MRTADCNGQIRKKSNDSRVTCEFVSHAAGAQHLLCCVVLKKRSGFRVKFANDSARRQNNSTRTGERIDFPSQKGKGQRP
jgi:hypothetical protein